MRRLYPATEFSQRIALHSLTNARNELGEQVGTWAEAARAWARVRPVTGKDETAADAPMATATYRFTIRACTALTPAALASMRVVWGGQTYYVVGEPLRIDGPRGYLQITATSQKVNDV